MKAKTNPFKLSITNFNETIDHELKHLLTTAVTQTHSIHDVYVDLLEIMAHTPWAAANGSAPYLAYTGLCGKNHDAFIPAAASQGMLHHLLLICDDIKLAHKQ